MAYRVDRSVTIRTHTGEELVALLDETGHVAAYVRPTMAEMCVGCDELVKRLDDFAALMKFLRLQLRQMLHAVERHIEKG